MVLNVYGVLVLITLVGAFLLDALARRLDCRSLREDVPAEFAGHYDPDAYRRSQRYIRSRSAFGLFEGAVDLLVVLGFWGWGGFGRLDRWVRQVLPGVLPENFAEHPVTLGLVYVGVLVLANLVLSLPFRVYSTFVLEERFGFNRTTLRTFVLDLSKGLALALLLGAPLLAAVIAFLHYGGEWAWLWAWGAASLFAVALQYVVPTWILPLFNRFERLPDGELRDALLGYAQRVGFALADVFVVDGSRRSTKANAFFTGFGRRKRIALYDTLLKSHSTPELVAVLAHEVGHYKKGHLLQGLVVGILHLGAMLFLLHLFLEHAGLYRAFGVEQPSIHVGLVLFGLLMTPVDLLLNIGLNAWSRRNEYQADRYAADTTGAGETLAAALKKLSVDHLSNLTPHPLRVVLEYSHPPILSRISAIRATVGCLRRRGFGRLGRVLGSLF